MIVEFLDYDQNRLYVLDSFKSLIWTDRYWEAGDFDLVMAPKPDFLEILPDVVYARIKESLLHIMFVETFAIDSDIEEGVSLVIKGRSAETLLDRRVIYEPATITGNLQTGILSLLANTCGALGETDRRFWNFGTDLSTDPAVTALTADTQFLGNLYDIICNLCIAQGVGWRIYPLPLGGTLKFQMYMGKDRSYSQSTNPYVIFSPTFDNLLNGSYIESSMLQRSHCYVAGEQGIENIRKVINVPAPGTPPTGFYRREMYFEANISRNVEGGELTEAEYEDQLTAKALEELAKNVYVKTFDGTVDTSMYNFGDEFDMGDIVQIMDGYGHSTKARVTEMIYSQDATGTKMYPTFTNMEE
jgi:hypothetical protein